MRCPDCGRIVSANESVCDKCGFVLQRNVLAHSKIEPSSESLFRYELTNRYAVVGLLLIIIASILFFSTRGWIWIASLVMGCVGTISCAMSLRQKPHIFGIIGCVLVGSILIVTLLSLSFSASILSILGTMD